AIKWAEEARETKSSTLIGVVGNAAEVYAELLRRGFEPDVVTDQTSAHDPLRGYIPAPLSVDEAADLRARDPQEYLEMVKHSVRQHVGAMLGFQRKGIETFDYGNNLRGLALESGVANAFDIPGFVPAYIRPLFAEGKGPFRWVALSGDPEDIYRTDRAVMETLPDNEHLHRCLKLGRWRRHRQLDPRGHGRRRRRNAGDGRAAGAGADDGPRHGRDPPCGRRLRDRDRLRRHPRDRPGDVMGMALNPRH